MRTPTYRIELAQAGFAYTPGIWRREAGRPNQANLQKYVEALEASSQPGGANQHLGVVKVLCARIVRQADSLVMARYARS